jgi:DNA polymerase-3 subunit gamma/tau
VIGTIRSRTHHYPFRLVPPKVLAGYIAELCAAEGVAIEPAVLPLVVRAGAGSVRDSLSVLDQLIGGAGPDGVTYALAVALLGFTPDSLLDSIVDGFAAHDAGAVFSVIDKVIETGQDPKRFAEDLLRRLRDLVIVAAVPDAVSNGLIEVAEDQGERLRAQAATLGPAELTRAADTVADGLVDMRGATAPRLQLELICAKVLLPGADDSTRGVHARLDRIERRMTLGTIDVEPAGSPEAPTTQVSAPVDIPPPPSRVETPPPESSRASARQAVARPAARSEPDEAHGAAATEPQPGAGTGGQIGLADVRRLWPDILERVKERKKVTWVMLSQNAQVLAMDDTTLTIGLSHAGVRDNFIRSGHSDILREAMRAELLVDRRIEAVVDPSTGGGSPTPGSPPAGGSTGPASPAPPDSSWDRPPDPVQGPPPADQPPSGPTGSAEPPEPEAPTPGNTRSSKPRNGQASKRRAAEAAALASRSAPPEPSPDTDEVGENDILLEDDSRSHTELLGQVLGAKVIDEQPNS